MCFVKAYCTRSTQWDLAAGRLTTENRNRDEWYMMACGDSVVLHRFQNIYILFLCGVSLVESISRDLDSPKYVCVTCYRIKCVQCNVCVCVCVHLT